MVGTDSGRLRTDAGVSGGDRSVDGSDSGRGTNLLVADEVAATAGDGGGAPAASSALAAFATVAAARRWAGVVASRVPTGPVRGGSEELRLITREGSLPPPPLRCTSPPAAASGPPRCCCITVETCGGSAWTTGLPIGVASDAEPAASGVAVEGTHEAVALAPIPATLLPLESPIGELGTLVLPPIAPGVAEAAAAAAGAIVAGLSDAGRDWSVGRALEGKEGEVRRDDWERVCLPPTPGRR